MATTETILQPPAPRIADEVSKSLLLYIFTLQHREPLREVDTSAGPYAEDVPPAGLNSTTGQSNQNQEITYIKTSADANVFTLNGAANGPLTLVAQGDFLKIKSNGTLWRRSG